MSLGSFLTDESLGPSSWADEMEDLPAVRGSTYQRREYNAPSSTAPTDRYAGYSRNTDEGYTSGRPQLPVPDKPPFTAHIGNLTFEITEAEIEDFFVGCEVSNVRLVRDREQDRPKGFGYVEFATKDGLLKALDMNGGQLAGRNVRVNVAEPPKEREDARFQSEWRRGGPLPDLPTNNRRGSGYERSDSHRSDREEGGRRYMDREGESRVRDMGSWERKGPLSPLPPTSPTSERPGRTFGGDREFRRRSPAPDAEGTRGGFRERPQVERQPSAAETADQWRRSTPPQRSTPTSPTVAHTRPKLELKKRSEVPVDSATTAAPISGEKPNPFGAARPIDTLKREKEVEEKRAALAAERKAAEEKAREEKRLAAEKKAAEEAEAKATEAAAPAVEKVEVLRRGSGPPGSVEEEGKEASGRVSKEPREARQPERPRVPDNWRSRPAATPRDARPPRQQPVRQQSQQQQQQEAQPEQAAQEDEGWSTVKIGKKRGGRY
ncbi:RNA-binding domain-containing protein [Ascodesmis nigricans]|uniref:RNA-binding domain-containing protein n=1 Tax=Ascodesmis nigricans TaxID=341454 RepID=A0A4S2MVD5_9PEZI|nr:RNA-binding domain-containing protein [Ascodesmis nigricans]